MAAIQLHLRQSNHQRHILRLTTSWDYYKISLQLVRHLGMSHLSHTGYMLNALYIDVGLLDVSDFGT